MTPPNAHYFNSAHVGGSFEPVDGGGVVVHNVPLMAAGSWTSMQGQRTVFTDEVLSRCATKWRDTGIWARHPGGAPRDVTDKIGAVQNPHFDPAQHAVVGDLYLHGKTSTSADAVRLVQTPRDQGGITDVSAETVLDLEPDGTVRDIVWTGLALVEDGACETCRIPAYSKGDRTMADETKVDPSKTDEKKPVDAAAGAGDENHPGLPEAAEPAILSLIIDAVDQLIPDMGIKDMVGQIISANKGGKSDEQMMGMGALKQALTMACHACGQAADHSKQEQSVDFAKVQKERDELAAKVASYEARFSRELGKTNTVAQPVAGQPAEHYEAATDMTLNTFSHGRMYF